MDERTAELRAAHDILADLYRARLAHLIDEMPIERSVLGLFAELVITGGNGTSVGDIGCGTGRMAPYLHGLGLSPRGVDLSSEMVRVARLDHPDFRFEVADLRELPFDDAALAGVVCWYSLMYLEPVDRPDAFAELARVVSARGYLATAFKLGEDEARRGGRSVGLGIEFDVYWHSHAAMERQLTEAGFRVVYRAERPADPDELQPQGYLVAQRLPRGSASVTPLSGPPTTD